MAEDRAAPLAAELVEQPTRAAQLTITEQPARVKITARRWGSAEGIVPPTEAHHLITTIGLIGSVITGTAGAVLTLRIDPHLTVLAAAELAVATMIATLVALCGRRRR